MGLNEGTNATYIGISDGKISLRVKESTPGAIQIVNKESGKVSWMKYYRSITGYLTGIVNKPDKFNDKAYNWHLTIVDGDDTYIMQVRERSGYGRSLMKSLPNVDFNEKITFSPYVKVVDDKKRGTLYLQQRGENVDWYFTQEHPNGLPELEKRIDARGNVTYDDSAVLDFFLKYVENVIQPRIEAANRRRLGELPKEEPVTDGDDSTAWMEREHERQIAAIRTEQAASGSQTSPVRPFMRNQSSPRTFSDGMPIPDDMPADLPF